ncbi:MAG: TOP6B-like family protein [Alphaproteobacteria bacterium]|nr:TOP6B-like family protein [Alphaproteobacteria bacterium]
MTLDSRTESDLERLLSVSPFKGAESLGAPRATGTVRAHRPPRAIERRPNGRPVATAERARPPELTNAGDGPPGRRTSRAGPRGRFFHVGSPRGRVS